jgi:hypothetical protein
VCGGICHQSEQNIVTVSCTHTSVQKLKEITIFYGKRKHMKFTQVKNPQHVYNGENSMCKYNTRNLNCKYNFHV